MINTGLLQKLMPEGVNDIRDGSGGKELHSEVEIHWKKEQTAGRGVRG
jgi:hypothetical protein